MSNKCCVYVVARIDDISCCKHLLLFERVHQLSTDMKAPGAPCPWSWCSSWGSSPARTGAVSRRPDWLLTMPNMGWNHLHQVCSTWSLFGPVKCVFVTMIHNLVEEDIQVTQYIVKIGSCVGRFKFHGDHYRFELIFILINVPTNFCVLPLLRVIINNWSYFLCYFKGSQDFNFVYLVYQRISKLVRK